MKILKNSLQKTFFIFLAGVSSVFAADLQQTQGLSLVGDPGADIFKMTQILQKMKTFDQKIATIQQWINKNEQLLKYLMNKTTLYVLLNTFSHHLHIPPEQLAEQFKKFNFPGKVFVAIKIKSNLDRLLTEYKKANPSTDYTSPSVLR